MFIVQVNDHNGVPDKLVYVGCDRSLAETAFIDACKASVKNWDRHRYRDDTCKALLDDGFCRWGDRVINFIDTDGFTSDDAIRDELTGQPAGAMTVAEIVQDGEVALTEGMTVDEIIELCGRNLDAACSWDIQGEILFKGSDGKWYTINTESIIGIANPEWVEETIAENKNG